MSHENVQRFQQSINEDGELRSALQQRFGDLSNIPAGELVGFAGEHGYRFTVEEAQEQLSDAQLEGVTGGAAYLKLDGIKGETRYVDKSSPILMLGYSSESISFNFTKI